MSTDPESAPAPTFRQAERLAVTWLRNAGYTDAGPVGEDAPPGVDITATWALAQVRHGETTVRRSELQRLIEARGDRPDVALYSFASRSFDLPAVTYADTKGVALFSYTASGAMLPRNTVASRLVGKPIAGRKAIGDDGGPPAPPAILRWAPLLVAAYLAVLAGILAVNLAQGAPGASVVYLVLAAVGALGFFALWFFGTRRRPRTPEKAPPRT